MRTRHLTALTTIATLLALGACVPETDEGSSQPSETGETSAPAKDPAPKQDGKDDKSDSKAKPATLDFGKTTVIDGVDTTVTRYVSTETNPRNEVYASFEFAITAKQKDRSAPSFGIACKESEFEEGSATHSHLLRAEAFHREGDLPVGKRLTDTGQYAWGTKGLRADSKNIRCDKAYVVAIDLTFPDGYGEPSQEKVLARWLIPKEAREEINSHVAAP